MKDAVRTGRSPRLLELAQNDVNRLDPGLLERAATEGDPAASEIYERAAAFLALSVANQITVLNPARLILGGGVLNHCPGLRKRIVEGIEQYSSRVSREKFKVVEASLADDSGLIGAALLANA
jgi:glucokinase